MEETKAKDFIREIVEEDLRTNKHGGRVATRFPPEPNGYLHIGHAKSICLNFGIAKQYGGTCNLRMDDTNPTKEDVEYVESIAHDVQWLGFSFGGKVLHASDYFEQMFELAKKLIRDGKAYVCHLNEEDTRKYRGTLTEPGRPSPYRERSVAENLDLFERMARGEFPDGTCVLRAKIDLASPNMKMRDPLLYRIKRVPHDRTGDRWNIYPMYDYAHPLSDSFEQITHSICTLEFDNNRELYDWVLEHTGVPFVSHQYEFARLVLDYTVMSKRKLLLLVQQKLVSGWDDPRMPTIAGMRRRGYSPEAIRAFAEMIGVSKHNSVVDIGKLEYCVRDDLNRTAPRVMGVVRPLKVTLTNYPEGETKAIEAPLFPQDSNKTDKRTLPFSRTLYLEREDFEENPPKDYLRLAPGRTVRLRYGCCVRCDEVVKNAQGEVVELRCSYFPETFLGGNPQGEKVWGVLHWLSAEHAVPCEVRLYDRLFTVARPDASEDVDFLTYLNAKSLEVRKDAWVEPSVKEHPAGSRYQFERVGYFCLDVVDSKPGALVFNRVVGLKEGWAKPQETPAAKEAAPESPKSSRGNTRPAGRSKADVRKDTRAKDAALNEQFTRFPTQYGVSADDADLLTADRDTAKLFEEAVAGYRAELPDADANAAAKSVARWVINELPREVADRALSELKFSFAHVGVLAALQDRGTVTAPVARELLGKLVNEGSDPKALAAAVGGALSESAVLALIEQVMTQNAEKVSQYRSGKTGLLGFFVGQVVKASRGQASPPVVQKLLQEKLA